MMTTRVKNEILLTISTHLDGRLSEREKAEFEARLSVDVETRELLESLLVVKLALTQAPRRTAPRNFAIPQEIARKIKRNAVILPVFRFASAIAAVASMLLFAFAYLLNPISVAAPMALSAQEKSSSQSAFEVNGQPVIITWGDPYSSIGGMGGGGGGDLSTAKSVENFSLESPVIAEPAPAMEGVPAMPQPELQAESAVSADELPVISGSGPILGIAPDADQAEDAQTRRLPQNPAILSLNAWQIAGAISLIMALACGLIAYLTGRKKY